MNEFPWTYDQYQRYAVISAFLKVFQKDNTIKVLDVGALSPKREGRGFWLPIKQILPERSFAIDHVFYAVKDFIQGDARTLPFKDGCFDLVTAMDVLEHLSKEDRSLFLHELSRVSRGSVLLSAPFQDEAIKDTEKLLSTQIKKLYGIEHRQLKEHSAHGLPQIEDVTATLKPLATSNASFSYGSLYTWIFNQLIKNAFLVGKNGGNIQEQIDRWMVTRFITAEFLEPFSRHFWVASKDISQHNLDAGIEKIKDRLAQKEHPFPDSPVIIFEDTDWKNLNREILEFYSRDWVSALVVSSGDSKNLFLCLEHLLTQKVDFELEVWIWEIAGNSIDKRSVTNRFPAVKFIQTQPNVKLAQGLLEILPKLRGNDILLLTQDTLLSPDSARTFYDRLHKDKEYGLFVPQVFEQSGKGHVWYGMGRLKKTGAGRFLKLAGKGKREGMEWIFSECLFFNRAALSGRVIHNRRLNTRSLFLWEKARNGKKILYDPDWVVHRK